MSYTATFKNASGTSYSSSLSNTTGSSSDRDAEWLITITAPSTAGDYTLSVTYTEKITVDGVENSSEYTKTAVLHVCTPITLKVTVSNEGTSDIKIPVYFAVDGVKVDDSKQDLSVSAGSTASASYEYYQEGLSSGSHTYSLVSAETGYPISGLDNTYTFYYNQGDMNYAVYIMAVILVILVIAAVWVFRKPVKNYGKPKARR